MGGVWCQTLPTTTPKLNLLYIYILDINITCSYLPTCFWSEHFFEDLTNIVWLYLLICAQIFDFKVCSSYIYIVFETNIGNFNNFDYMELCFAGHFCLLRNDRNGWSDVQTPPPLKFSPKVFCCWIFFWETQFCIRFQNI